MLTASPSSTTPSLQAGDPTRNSLLKIATIGVKYCSKEDVQYLHHTIVKKYTCEINWDVNNF